MERFVVAFVVAVAVVAGIACRGTEPRTPPNSPIPEIEKPSEPGGPPPNPLRDAGSPPSSSSP